MDVSWTIKKAECRRIDAFELWCWGRLESPLDCKEIKPVNVKGSKPWIFIGRTDAEAPIIGHLMQRTGSLEKTLMLERLKAGGERDNRGWNDWMASPIWWTWVWANSGRWWSTGKSGVLQSMGFQRVGHNWADWIATNYCIHSTKFFKTLFSYFYILILQKIKIIF